MRGFHRKHTEETKRKISASKLGTPAWNKGLSGFRAGEKRPYMTVALKGKKRSVETIEKIRMANTKPKITKNCLICNKEFEVIPSCSFINFCGKICRSKNQSNKIPWNKGLKGFRKGEKHSWMPQGENHWSWKGGISKDVHSIKEPKYREWRMKVFLRDGFKCRINNKDCEGQPIQAHHILRWSEYVELRYDVNNGITLCLAHHPRKRAEEKRLVPVFRELVSVSKE